MKNIPPDEAIKRLQALQCQIIDGKRTFVEIADCIDDLLSRNAELNAENQRLREALRGMVKDRLGNEGYADGLWHQWAAKYHNDAHVDRPLLSAVYALQESAGRNFETL